MTRPGPKPGPPGSQRTARLVVRVTPAELSAYQAAAGRAGVSMGEWVRARLAADPADPLRAASVALWGESRRVCILANAADDPRKFADLNGASRGLRLAGNHLDYMAGDEHDPTCVFEPAAAEKEHGG